jgi:hypothetical protein
VPDTETSEKIQRRRDPESRPARPEVVRGNLIKESGWFYHRVHQDDVHAQTFPRTLEPSGETFGGWEPVKDAAPLFRRADDTVEKDGPARDMDTVWMRCRQEEYEKIVRNENMKHSAVVKRLRTDDLDPGQVSVVNKWRGPDNSPVFSD